MRHLLLFLILASCAQSEKIQTSSSTIIADVSHCETNASNNATETLKSLLICEQLQHVGGEGFPFIWKSQLRYLSSPRIGNTSAGLEIPGIGIVGPKNMLFVSGIVENETLYVYGVNGVSDFSQNMIWMTSSQDLINWTIPVAVLTSAPTEPFFNTSVSFGPQGFVMTTEIHDPITGYYEFRISHAANLIGPWSAPGPLYKSTYSACPTVRYSNGYYYVTYLSVIDETNSNIHYVTKVTRSKDLLSWDDAPNVLFAPTIAQGSNMSDVDMIEFQGHLEMIVYDGDQMTWGNPLRAVYMGTFDQLMQETF